MIKKAGISPCLKTNITGTEIDFIIPFDRIYDHILPKIYLPVVKNKEVFYETFSMKIKPE